MNRNVVFENESSSSLVDRPSLLFFLYFMVGRFHGRTSLFFYCWSGPVSDTFLKDIVRCRGDYFEVFQLELLHSLE